MLCTLGYLLHNATSSPSRSTGMRALWGSCDRLNPRAIAVQPRIFSKCFRVSFFNIDHSPNLKSNVSLMGFVQEANLRDDGRTTPGFKPIRSGYRHLAQPSCHRVLQTVDPGPDHKFDRTYCRKTRAHGLENWGFAAIVSGVFSSHALHEPTLWGPCTCFSQLALGVATSKCTRAFHRLQSFPKKSKFRAFLVERET